MSSRRSPRSAVLVWSLAGLLSVPVLVVVLLLLLLGGGVAADAASQDSVPERLRSGSVPAAYEDLVVQAAQACPGFTAPLLAAQLDAESGWNPNAVSPVGAQGLAQFMPATWSGVGLDGNGDGVRDPFDPADAIPRQAAYLCKLLTTIDAELAGGTLNGDRIDLALAAYNAGLGTILRFRGVPPYAETEGYIARIRSLLLAYGAPAFAIDGSTGPWVRPIIEDAPISSGFGGRNGRLHAGIDFAAPVGTPVLAASHGTVLAAGPASGFGYWVKLGHPGGITTVYGHLSAWTVAVGQPVSAGEVIGYSGNEGRSTGPHLHFETRRGDQPIDPAALYAAQGAAL